MTSRIDWVTSSCRLLQGIAKEFRESRPFAEMTIGTGIHLEPKTAVLLCTLRDGGARVIATGNLNSTQDETVEYLRGQGIEVVGSQTRDRGTHERELSAVLEAHPQLILDNGGDLFLHYLKNPYVGLLGGTEETTSGRMRLENLRGELNIPILVINDSPIKQFAENEHAVGQSVFESFMRFTNRSTQGKRVVVFGYGACGRGIAANFRNAYAIVTVLEINPVTLLNACLDGYVVQDREKALSEADIVITATGVDGVVGPKDLAYCKDDVILANAGHFPFEIAVDEILHDSSIVSTEASTPGLLTLRTADGRRIHLLGNGHMVNLAGPSPLGNSIESMDLGFALQARCLELIATGNADPRAVVVPVPQTIDEMVAQSYLDLIVASTSP